MIYPKFRLNFDFFETESPFDYVELLSPHGNLLKKISGSWTRSIAIRQGLQ